MYTALPGWAFVEEPRDKTEERSAERMLQGWTCPSQMRERAPRYQHSHKHFMKLSAPPLFTCVIACEDQMVNQNSVILLCCQAKPQCSHTTTSLSTKQLVTSFLSAPGLTSSLCSIKHTSVFVAWQEGPGGFEPQTPGFQGVFTNRLAKGNISLARWLGCMIIWSFGAWQECHCHSCTDQ